jgi:hypothetical protein
MFIRGQSTSESGQIPVDLSTVRVQQVSGRQSRRHGRRFSKRWIDMPLGYLT